MLERKSKIKEKVIELLIEDERCRNDDKWLIWRFLREKQGINIFIPFSDFERMVSFESIRRCRAFIQNNENRYLPTDEKIRKARRINEIEWLEWLRKEKDKLVE